MRLSNILVIVLLVSGCQPTTVSPESLSQRARSVLTSSNASVVDQQVRCAAFEQAYHAWTKAHPHSDSVSKILGDDNLKTVQSRCAAVRLWLQLRAPGAFVDKLNAQIGHKAVRIALWVNRLALTSNQQLDDSAREQLQKLFADQFLLRTLAKEPLTLGFLLHLRLLRQPTLDADTLRTVPEVRRKLFDTTLKVKPRRQILERLYAILAAAKIVRNQKLAGFALRWLDEFLAQYRRHDAALLLLPLAHLGYRDAFEQRFEALRVPGKRDLKERVMALAIAGRTDLIADTMIRAVQSGRLLDYELGRGLNAVAVLAPSELQAVADKLQRHLPADMMKLAKSVFPEALVPYLLAQNKPYHVQMAKLKQALATSDAAVKAFFEGEWEKLSHERRYTILDLVLLQLMQAQKYEHVLRLLSHARWHSAVGTYGGPAGLDILVNLAMQANFTTAYGDWRSAVLKTEYQERNPIQYRFELGRLWLLANHAAIDLEQATQLTRQVDELIVGRLLPKAHREVLQSDTAI